MRLYRELAAPMAVLLMVLAVSISPTSARQLRRRQGDVAVAAAHRETDTAETTAHKAVANAEAQAMEEVMAWQADSTRAMADKKKKKKKKKTCYYWGGKCNDHPKVTFVDNRNELTRDPGAPPKILRHYVSPDQDCEWTDWSTWSKCSKSCGAGVATRHRSVALDEKGEGKACSGPKAETKKCEDQECPKVTDAKWAEWSKWGDCSRNCDGGTQVRTRRLEQEATNGGKDAVGKSEERRTCNRRKCRPGEDAGGSDDEERDAEERKEQERGAEQKKEAKERPAPQKKEVEQKKAVKQKEDDDDDDEDKEAKEKKQRQAVARVNHNCGWDNLCRDFGWRALCSWGSRWCCKGNGCVDQRSNWREVCQLQSNGQNHNRCPVRTYRPPVPTVSWASACRRWGMQPLYSWGRRWCCRGWGCYGRYQYSWKHLCQLDAVKGTNRCGGGVYYAGRSSVGSCSWNWQCARYGMRGLCSWGDGWCCSGQGCDHTRSVMHHWQSICSLRPRKGVFRCGSWGHRW